MFWAQYVEVIRPRISGLLHLLLVAITALAFQIFVCLSFARCAISRSSLLKVIFQPPKHKLTQLAVAAFWYRPNIEAFNRPPFFYSAEMHMYLHASQLYLIPPEWHLELTR